MEHYYQKYTDYPKSSMADWVFQQLKLFAAEEGKIAQIFADDGSSWTYEQLLRNSVHVAAGLGRVGINPGDMVSFLARNTHELYAVVLGCIMADVIVVPSIADLQPSELVQNLLIVNPKFVIAGAQFIPAVENALTSLNSKPQIFEIQHLFKESTAKGVQVDPSTFQPVHVADPKSHVFSCLFSSGTTGRPKSVAMTDYGLLRTVFLASRFHVKNATGIACNPSQMHWISWWFIVLRSLFRGWTRIFMDKDTPVYILEAIQKFKPSLFFGSPSALSGMAHEMDKNPGRWDLSSLRAIFPAGDICNKFSHERLCQKFNLPLFQEYGSTESGFVLQGRVESPVVYGSAGKPMAPLKLVDVTTGKEITEPNKPGEIVVQWKVFREFVNNPEATANALDENGWMKMGDIAIFDESGNFFIVDRVKEMLKYCCYQIAPSELEDIIRKIPGVKDTGVTGKPVGVEIGEVPTAFVVRSPGSKLTEKDILDYLEKEKLHDSKRLRGGVIFTEEIPRNVNGKIVRSKLKELLNQSQTLKISS